MAEYDRKMASRLCDTVINLDPDAKVTFDGTGCDVRLYGVEYRLESSDDCEYFCDFAFGLKLLYNGRKLMENVAKAARLISDGTIRRGCDMDFEWDEVFG